MADSRTELPSPHRQDVAAEQDPERWWQALQSALDQLCVQIDCHAVQRMALDGTSSTLLLCTPDGKPASPALMYNDARASQQADSIAAIAPADSPVRSASSSLAKLLYLLQQYPPSPAIRCLHQADWLTGKLLGQFRYSDENNALKLGYDAQRRCWPDWLKQLNLPDHCLPEVLPPGTPLGPLQRTHRQRWGFTDNARIVAGTTDSTAGFIATGADRIGTAVTALGSTLVMKVLAGQPVSAPEYGVYSHRLGDRWLVGGASNCGGAVLKQFFDNRQLTELSKQLDPASPSPLEYTPLPGVGERFPVNDPSLQPVLAPRPASDADYLHGLLESLARVEQRGYQLLSELGAPYPEKVISVGGGAVNATWSAIRERLLGVPVIAAEQQEAAYGAALLARGL